jgi:hypothetical protein
MIPLVELIIHHSEKLLAFIMAINEIVFPQNIVFVKKDVIACHLLKNIVDSLCGQLLSELIHVLTFEGSTFSNKGGALVLPFDQLSQVYQTYFL